MNFFNTKTKEYPRHQADLELLGWTFGSQLPPDWVQVDETPCTIEVPKDHKALELEPVFDNGIWKRQFTTIPLTLEEIEKRDESPE